MLCKHKCCLQWTQIDLLVFFCSIQVASVGKTSERKQMVTKNKHNIGIFSLSIGPPLVLCSFIHITVTSCYVLLGVVSYLQ